MRLQVGSQRQARRPHVQPSGVLPAAHRRVVLLLARCGTLRHSQPHVAEAERVRDQPHHQFVVSVQTTVHQTRESNHTNNETRGDYSLPTTVYGLQACSSSYKCLRRTGTCTRDATGTCMTLLPSVAGRRNGFLRTWLYGQVSAHEQPPPRIQPEYATSHPAHARHRALGGGATQIIEEGSSLPSPGKWLHHQRSSRHAMVPLSDTSPHPEG